MSPAQRSSLPKWELRLFEKCVNTKLRKANRRGPFDATTGIKWTHLAELDGPTYGESNNNQKLHFQNWLSLKNLLKHTG
jgi:hypothetical protein